jgi:hypothetical protein
MVLLCDDQAVVDEATHAQRRRVATQRANVRGTLGGPTTYCAITPST